MPGGVVTPAGVVGRSRRRRCARPQTLDQRILGRKPLKRSALIFVGLVTTRLAGEVGTGVIDGFMAVWRDRV